MPYSLVFVYDDGSRSELKPLQCNNPGSPHGLEDRGIKRNAENVAARINRMDDAVACHVEHY